MKLPTLVLLLVFHIFSFGQFVNGDFQTAFTYGCTAGPGWTTSTGNGTEPEITDIFQPGDAWIDLTPCGGWGNGTWIEQDVATVVGNCYSVTFDLGSYCGWDASDAGIFVLIDGDILGDRIVNDVFDCAGIGPRWDTYTSEVFVATSTTTTIRFTGEGRCTALSSPNGPYPCAPIGAIGNPGVMGFDNVILNSLGFSASVITLDDVNICPNESVIIGNSIPGMQFLWNTGASTPTITVQNPGTYTFTYTGACSSGEGSVDVIRVDPPTPFSLGSDTLLCAPFDFILIAPDISTVWSSGNTSNAIHVVLPGIYFATSSNECGSFRDSIEIFSVDSYIFSLNDAYDMCEGDSLLFEIPPFYSSVVWQDGSAQSKYAVTKSGNYEVEFFDGCETQHERFQVDADDCNCNFYIPNSFTANGDGINDIWQPYLDTNCEFTLQLFNRWGEKIFEMDKPGSVWTGGESADGYYVPDGVYTYRLTYKYNKVDWKEKAGTLCLIR